MACTVPYVFGGGSHTVSYDTTRGGAIPDYETKPVAAEYTPTCEGYAFEGWYTDEARTQRWDFEDEVKRDLQLYDKWTINTPEVEKKHYVLSTGTPLGTVTPAGEGQAVSYSLDGETWQGSPVTARAAGTYTVHWKVSADACDDLTGSFAATVQLVTIASWTSGTDAQVSAMLGAYYDGVISREDMGWKVGDKRPVALSAMSATGVGESHVAQTVQMVIVNEGGKELEDGTECCYVVQLENFLSNGTNGEYGYMNSSDTNAGGWESCARRKWCNEVFRNAVPSALRGIFKKHKNLTTKGSQSSEIVESWDWFALPSNAEVGLRKGTASYDDEGTQWSYYTDNASRVKKAGSSGSADSWWLRSPYTAGSTSFCRVFSGGSYANGDASRTGGLAPSGCM